MIKFILGGIDVSDKINSCQFGKNEESGGNGFVSVTGETVSDVTAVKLTVTVELTELTTVESEEIINILNGSDIDVACDFESYNGVYERDGGYSFGSVRTDTTGIWWKISFTLFRCIPRGGTSADGL